MNNLNIATQIIAESARITDLALQIDAPQTADWDYPVGSLDHPIETWYSASLNDLTGRRNNGYPHTGLDLNIDKAPWGDVDRGQPVFSVADGEVYSSGYSTNYLGGLVVKCDHFGVPLWVRYWHIEFPLGVEYQRGDQIEAGQHIGAIGNYKLGAGGDHLHLDMAWMPFEPHWWFTKHPEISWADPEFVLKMHLYNDLVDAMLRKGQ